MSAQAKDSVGAFIRAQMPEDVRAACELALRDLHEGPSLDDNEDRDPALPLHVHGFESACKHVSRWFSEYQGEAWYDSGCGEVLTEEPQPFDDGEGGTIDPEWSEIVYFSERDVKRAAFGELAQYL
jgi:hypothetical protein